MSESDEIVRESAAEVLRCPVCGAVFKLTCKSKGKKAVACPTCMYLLSNKYMERTRESVGANFAQKDMTPDWDKSGPSKNEHTQAGGTNALKLLILSSLLGLVFVIGVLIFVAVGNKGDDVVSSQPQDTGKRAVAREFKGAETPLIFKDKEAGAIEEVLSQFPGLKTTQDVLALILISENSREHILKDLDQGVIEQLRGVKYISDERISDRCRKARVGQGFGSFDMYFIKENDQWKLDYSAFRGVGDMSVEQYISSGILKPVTLRGMIGVSNFYIGDYTDTNRWQSFVFYSPDLEHKIYLYLDREGKHGEKFSELLKVTFSNPGQYKYSLSIILNEKSVKRNIKLAEIDDVLSNGWFIER